MLYCCIFRLHIFSRDLKKFSAHSSPGGRKKEGRRGKYGGREKGKRKGGRKEEGRNKKGRTGEGRKGK